MTSRKEAMKVYHGIPKSVTDDHTVFYNSFDGVYQPKVGTILKTVDNIYFKPSPTGLAMYYPTQSTSYIKYKLNETLNIYNNFTIDFWININEFRNVANSTYPEVMTFENSEDARSMKLYVSGTNKHIYVEISTPTWYESVAITPKFDTLPDYCHIRLTSNGTLFKTYCNGINIATYTIKLSNNHRNFLNLTIHSYRVYSDLHISNIDRGDYFPNLPQDFIEGKAIIKPRMGQQQIKGDPMYSQTTLLKVPAQSADKLGTKYGFDVDSDNTTTCLESPELRAGYCHVWRENDSKIKIKGLNGEIISGVIDSDTALCKAITYIVDGNTPQIKVNTTTGLTVGDTLRIFNTKTFSVGSEILTVTNIDNVNNIITLSGAASTYNNYNLNIGWDTFIEVYSSSSSPIVKTSDGTTVVGTWTGLGTNEAKFTLGSNSSIAGKDLYVEYSLTMPYGNSDFNELPYSVDRAWGENGVEMKPASKVIISDDFKGKISGSTKECPHINKCTASTSLINPSTFSQEYTQSDYFRLSSLDGSSNYVTNNGAGKIPQQLFSFNLIEMIERKLGCEIPTTNKVQWVKDNVTQLKLRLYGKGSCPLGTLVHLTAFLTESNKWNTTKFTNNTNTIIEIAYGTTSVPSYVDSNGFVHFLVYTDASDGTTSSTVYVDYAYLNLELKLDSSYTVLYCENTRSREDKCNPVLIQKETKTVKRYLPSKECFVTECKYVNMKKSSISYTDLYDNSIENGNVYSTTQGSGAYSGVMNGWRYKNIINLLRLSTVNPYNFYNDGLYQSPFTSNLYTTFSIEPADNYIACNDKFMPRFAFDHPRYLCFKPYIKVYNNEVKMCISSSEIIKSAGGTSHSNIMSNQEFYSYTLPNRPLIK